MRDERKCNDVSKRYSKRRGGGGAGFFVSPPFRIPFENIPLPFLLFYLSTPPPKFFYYSLSRDYEWMEGRHFSFKVCLAYNYRLSVRIIVRTHINLPISYLLFSIPSLDRRPFDELFFPLAWNSPRPIIVSFGRGTYGDGIIVSSFPEESVVSFRVIGPLIRCISFVSFFFFLSLFPVPFGTRGRRGGGDPVRSMCFPVGRGRARYLSRRLPLLHERAPVPASGITRRAFPGLGGHLQTCARHFQWR